MRLALYQPDIPQNCGALIRLAACLGVGLDIIEPCGFLLDDRRLKRAGLDYHSLAEVRRHRSWEAFQAARQAGRASLGERSEEHPSGLQSLMRISYATFCLLKQRAEQTAP